jgi:cytochrome bd ubiquinol oxidase subunit I
MQSLGGVEVLDQVVIARSLFGTTMAFHIIFATLGVGLPMMIFVAELFFQFTKDEDYSIMAQRWTKGFAVLLGVGIPTGTIAAVQLSLLWPKFMEAVGKVIALPFQIEIFAFMLEALFMSIYVYAANRMSRGMRILSVALVAFGAMMSAVLITDVHSFEDTPTGFRIDNGQIVDVHAWQAFFNPSFPVTATHVAVSAYMVGSFTIASIAAWRMLKRKAPDRQYVFHQKALLFSLVIGGIFSFMTAFNGHDAAQHLHREQPEKLAAAEGLFETQSHAPLSIMGFANRETRKIDYAVEIPGALSFLAGNSFDTVVQGLNEFPEENWPPLFIHTLFDLMVGFGSALIAISFLGFGWKRILKRDRFPRWMMYAFVFSGPAAMLAIECGWIFSCTGRQPWIIYHVMRTSEATTSAGNLGLLFVLFTGVYLLLAVSVLAVLRYYFKRHPLEEDLGLSGKEA